jgi:uncharacterized protein YhhL (DUF1145 family)
MSTSTLPAAKRTFIALAIAVALMGAYHLINATSALGDSDGHAWQHLLIGVLYLLSAMGLLFRPRGFVVFFGLVTVITVLVAVFNVWRPSTGFSLFSVELAAGFIVFPLALNLLVAETVHDASEATFGRGSGQFVRTVPPWRE